MIALGTMHLFCLRSTGQMTMPDHVCAGQVRQYLVNPGKAYGSTYTWWIDGNIVQNSGVNEFVHAWNSSGTYLLEVQETSANGCRGTKLPGLVMVNPVPEIRISVSDTLLCDGGSVTISVENPAVLLWGEWAFDLITEAEEGVTGNAINRTYSSPAILNEILFNNGLRIHKVIYRFIPVIANDEGIRCCEGEEVKITIWIDPAYKCREGFLEIPNAFSPNGDGINDVWNIIGKEYYPDIVVTIYNRWGQAVWKSVRGYPVPWDGRSLGKALPVDSYHYIIEFHDRSEPLAGTVTIVR